MVVGCCLPEAVSCADICRQEQNMLLKHSRLSLKVWESRALPSRLMLIFFFFFPQKKHDTLQSVSLLLDVLWLKFSWESYFS